MLGTHDLMVHDYGPGRRFASVHVEMAAENDVMQSHDIIDNIERDFQENDHISLIIHYDPILTGDDAVGTAREWVKELVRSISPELSIHDFRMVQGPSHTNLIFDTVVPHNFPLSDAALRKRIQSLVETHDAGETKYYAVVTIDHSYAAIPGACKTDGRNEPPAFWGGQRIRKGKGKNMEFKISDKMRNMKPSIIREILKQMSDPTLISFAGGNPAADSFPAEDIARFSDELLRQDPVAALQYSVSEGVPSVREAVRAFANRRERVAKENDGVLITSGSQQILDFAAKCLCNEGRRGGCGKPGVPGGVQRVPQQRRAPGRRADGGRRRKPGRAGGRVCRAGKAALFLLHPQFPEPHGQDHEPCQAQGRLCACGAVRRARAGGRPLRGSCASRAGRCRPSKAWTPRAPLSTRAVFPKFCARACALRTASATKS